MSEENEPRAGEPAEGVSVETPVEKQPFRPLVEEFAKELGMEEDVKHAALLLMRLLQESQLNPYKDLKHAVQQYSELINAAKTLKSLGPEAELVSEAVGSRAAIDLMNRFRAIDLESMDEKNLQKLVEKMLYVKLLDHLGDGRRRDEELKPLMEELRSLREELNQLRDRLYSQQQEVTVKALEKNQQENKQSSPLEVVREFFSALKEYNQATETQASKLAEKIDELKETLRDALSKQPDGHRGYTLDELLTNDEVRDKLAPLFAAGKMSLDDWIKLDKHISRKKLLNEAINHWRSRKQKEEQAKVRKQRLLEDTVEDMTQSISEAIERNAQPGEAAAPQQPTTLEKHMEGVFRCSSCGEELRYIHGLKQRIKCSKCGEEYDYEPGNQHSG